VLTESSGLGSSKHDSSASVTATLMTHLLDLALLAVRVGILILYVVVCVNIFVVAVWFLPFKPSSSVTRAGVNIYISNMYVDSW
jgi:hypothetical protein